MTAIEGMAGELVRAGWQPIPLDIAGWDLLFVREHGGRTWTLLLAAYGHAVLAEHATVDPWAPRVHGGRPFRRAELPPQQAVEAALQIAREQSSAVAR